MLGMGASADQWQHAGHENLRQDINDGIHGNGKIITGPLVEDADGAPNGRGNRIGKLVLAVAGNRGIAGDVRHITVEHRHHFSKELAAPRASKEFCQKRICHGVITDGMEIGTAQFQVILGMEGFH